MELGALALELQAGEGLRLLPALSLTESPPWIVSATSAVEELASSLDLALASQELLDLLLDHLVCPENLAAFQK